MMPSSWWLYVFWCSRLTDLGEGSMGTFRLPPVAKLVKTVFIPKRQHSYTVNKLKQETKTWQHLKQFKKKKELKKRQFNLALESRETSLYLKMPQVQEIASHRLAKA